MKKITLLVAFFFSLLLIKAQIPIANFSFSNVCDGDAASFVDLSTNTPTTWEWDFGDGGTSNLQNPNYNYTAPGSYNVTLIATNGFGSDTTQQFISVFPLPTVYAGTDVSICEGFTAQLNASGANSYTWSPTVGLNDPNLAAPISSVLSTTTYTLTGTDANGCIATDAVDVIVNAPPTINSVNHTQCGENGGDSATIDLTTLNNIVNGGSGETVNWYIDPGLTIPIANPSVYFADTTLTYLYTQITDANGCMNTDMAQINVAINDIGTTEFPTHVTCAGLCDGSISLTTFGGATPYTYSWSSGETTANINNLCAGTYTYTILDANACMYVNNVSITQPTGVSMVLTPTNPTCQNACDGYIASTAFGGTPPYAYNWDNGAGTAQNASGLCAGSYTLTITDANGCISSDMATLTDPAPNGVIAGEVLYQGSPISMGTVELIRKDGNTPADLTIVDTYSVTTGGVFHFPGLGAGNYLLKAYGDTTLYNCAPTYSDLTVQWDMAIEHNITSGCTNDSIPHPFELIEIPVNSGTGLISGKLIENNGSMTNKAPGDPIPDIDITVEQSPGGAIMGATTTDLNGDFVFDNLPDGSYIVYADMHGYSMNISGTLDLSAGSNNMNIVICSDDTTYLVGMCNTATSVSNYTLAQEISVYPNPANEMLNIYNPDSTPLNLTIADLSGKIVLQQQLTLESNQINLANLTTGVYLLQLSNNNMRTTQKLVIE